MELNGIINHNCTRHCIAKLRRDITDGDICNLIKSQLDGLEVRCVGKWAYDKIFRLNQYFGIFAKGMKDKWSGLNYIEICSGPGRCVLRETGEEINGTSLSIIQHPEFKWISKALFLDINQDIVEILNMRISNLKVKNAKSVIGDYSDLDSLSRNFEMLNNNFLNLVFIDPTDCSVPFTTIEFIQKKLSYVDFIINFPYGTDLIRNLRKSINNSNYACRKKYSEFLGIENYFTNPEVQELEKSSSSDKVLLNHFYKAFMNKLTEIGLKYFESKLVKNYYMLVFASSSKKGLEFWKKSQRISPDDQREINFS